MQRRWKIAAVTMLACAAPPLLTTAAQAQERVRYVTDGDTFRLASGERIRIAGIDAPESRKRQAKCSAEIALGKAAAAHARRLLDGQVVSLVRIGRSYDRTVAEVRLGGRDVAGQLVAAGVARWWPRRGPKPDWCSGRARR